MTPYYGQHTSKVLNQARVASFNFTIFFVYYA